MIENSATNRIGRRERMVLMMVEDYLSGVSSVSNECVFVWMSPRGGMKVQNKLRIHKLTSFMNS